MTLSAGNRRNASRTHAAPPTPPLRWRSATKQHPVCAPEAAQEPLRRSRLGRRHLFLPHAAAARASSHKGWSSRTSPERRSSRVIMVGVSRRSPQNLRIPILSHIGVERNAPKSHFSLWISLSTGCGLLRSLDRGMPGSFDDEQILAGAGGLLLVGRSPFSFPVPASDLRQLPWIDSGLVRSRVRCPASELEFGPAPITGDSTPPGGPPPRFTHKRGYVSCKK